jgi:glycogen debranching enzyme
MKIIEAKTILKSCVGKIGIWASNDRYRWQCWTRDFVIAVLPLLLERGLYLNIAKSHLNEMAKRQKPNGQIPILFIEKKLPWLFRKFMNALVNFRMPFMLKRFFTIGGVANLTPWTKDSEILYCLGVALYYKKTGDMMFWERHCQNIDKAIQYIQKNLMYGGLVFGGDWRDTKPEFSRTMLLTNNCFLYQAYKLLGMSLEAEDLKKNIVNNFWTGTHFRDYVGTDRFDTLGNALAIIYELTSSEMNDLIIKQAMALNTDFGFKLNGVTLPPKDAVEAELMKRIEQDGVIWPFISGLMIIAFYQAGQMNLARVEFDKWNQLPGFYEFYNPKNGQGHGSSDQLWSAVVYLRVAETLRMM